MYNMGLCAFGSTCYDSNFCDSVVLYPTLCSCQIVPFHPAVLFDNPLHICNFPATNVYLNINFYMGAENKII